MSDNASIVDDHRTVCLCDVGQPDYVAAVAVAVDGTEHLVLAQLDAINDTAVTYDPACRTVDHEQLGPLPLDVVKRLTVASRIHRCGRRTKAGTPCRAPVNRPGAACAWHPTTERKPA